MLKHIKIQRYKSLVDVDVSLNSLCVLFGPNAAGKSNFLDALQLLSRIGTSRTLKDAFEPPCRGKPLESFTFGNNGIKGLLDRETASFSIEADVELSDSVTETVNRQIQEMKKSGTSSETSNSGKLQSFVREKYLRCRIAAFKSVL
ncbi:MAG: AAA family ATPase [Desulfobacteraceae bacterium]|nr:AAA family ATPase [Desulfobacteraceae bacterium]